MSGLQQATSSSLLHLFSVILSIVMVILSDLWSIQVWDQRGWRIQYCDILQLRIRSIFRGFTFWTIKFQTGDEVLEFLKTKTDSDDDGLDKYGDNKDNPVVTNYSLINRTKKKMRAVLCQKYDLVMWEIQPDGRDIPSVYFLLLRPSSLADNVACCVVTQIQFVYVRASQWRMRQIHCESHINIWVHHFTKFQRRNNVP